MRHVKLHDIAKRHVNLELYISCVVREAITTEMFESRRVDVRCCVGCAADVIAGTAVERGMKVCKAGGGLWTEADGHSQGVRSECGDLLVRC